MRYIYFILMALFASRAIAADVNGYTALYECRAGGPNCNVDVATYTTAACAQTITTADSLATIQTKLNTGSSPICVTNGDYTAKGAVTITASGTSGAYRVMRYTRSGDNNDEPWNQTSGNQAKIWQLNVEGSYWIIHRLTFPPVTTGTNPNWRVQSGSYGGGNNASYHIFNRILIQGSGAPSGMIYYGLSQGTCADTYTNLTLQNSVVTGQYGDLTNSDSIAVNSQCGTNRHVVNNEIYNWAAHLYQAGSNSGGSAAGTVLENNDMYFDSTAHTNSGQKMKGEGAISFKQSGTSGSPALLFQNRIWGTRVTDLSFCCNGASGGAVGLGAGGGPNSDWILFKNNIVFDSQGGIEWTHWNAPSSANRNSIVGNLFYDMRKFLPSYNSPALWSGFYGVNTTEIYLNTIIGVDDWYADGPFNTNNDFRCNVMITAGTNNSSAGSGTQWDYQTYYGTTHNGDSNKIDKTLSTRANSTAYSLNAIIRTTATPPEDGTAGDFLYMVTTAGTSAGSPPAYTTTLGGTTTDGTMVVKAIRGPYSFYRKLRTGSELVYIPYAKVHNSAPEYNYCPSTTGNRSNIGISNTTGTW